MRQALEMLVQARASVVITGATGSGKTTLLASLLSLVPADERIVVIEEAGEVMPDHPHVVRLVERRPNVEGAGAVSLATLVREALRMRPDRVVLGECRGAEVREVLAAFNTGHRGGFMTLHANGPQDVPARFTSLSALAGLDERSALVHAGTAFDAVVHMERRDGRRVVAAIAAVKGGGGMTVLPALALAPDGTVVEGPGIGALEALCAA
jgi:pilus assembly protein CpaF